MTALLSRRSRLLLLPAAFLWVMSFAMLADNSTAAQLIQTQTGWMTLIYGDAPPGSTLPSQLEIHLLDDQGQIIARLAMADSAARPFYGKEVQVTGAFLDNGQAGMNGDALFMVDAIAPLYPAPDAPENEASTVPNPASSGKIAGSQPWVNILCKFSDVDTEPYSPSFFSTMFSSSYKGLDHYWRRTSYNQINLNGSTTTQWYTLPKPRSYYIEPGTYGADLNLLADDCAKAADSDLFFPNYVGVNLIFNDDLDCCAWGGGRTMSLDGQTRFYRVTWLPPWGQRHDIIAHEMGHGFGMPHSTGPANNPPAEFGVYVSDWDVMSAAGGMCRLWDDGRNHCLSQGTIAYHRDLAGWIPGTRITVAEPYTDTTFTLDRLIEPQTDDHKLMARVPIDDSPTHFYTIEVRDLNEYDQNVPTQAVVIHDVNTKRIGNAGHAYVVDADTNNNNVNDEGAAWSVGEAFYDADNNILIEILSADDGSYTVHVNNNASFISGVVMNETGDITLEAATVDVINAATGQWEGFAETQSDGSYSLAVPPGDHIVYAHADGYALEYYNGASNPGKPYYDDALPLFVPTSSTITNIDFHLNAGGSAVGVVTEDGGDPLPDMLIGIEETLLFTCTEADGSFTLSGIPLHTEFKLFSGGDNFCGGGGQGFTRQWWENAATPDEATPIRIENAAVPFDGLQFSLAKGGTLSGVVLSEEESTGIDGAWVCAYDFDSPDFDQINPNTCTQTNVGGSYTLKYVPVGLKLVRAFAYQHARLFYENATTYDDAELVLVASGSPLSGINFALPAAGTISGTVWEADGETPMEGVTISTAENEYVGCSDADGHYTLAVPPGTHIIMAGTGPCSSSSFPFLYYDDSLTLAGATAITIDAPGEDVVEIDFVRPAPTSNELLTNGGFEQGRAQNQGQAFGWKSRKLVTDKRVCDSAPVSSSNNDSLNNSGLRGVDVLAEPGADFRAQTKLRSKNGFCAFQFRANPGTNSSILQIVQPSKSATGDTLILAAWVEGSNVAGVSIYANIHYRGGGGVQNMKLPNQQLNGKSYGYTFHSVQRILHGKVNKVHIVIRQNNGKGWLRVDDMSLVLLQGNQQVTTLREAAPEDSAPVTIPIPDAPPDLRGGN